jgi:uncharacterized iron-regulated membrane protein
MRELLLLIVVAIVAVAGVWYYFGTEVHPPAPATVPSASAVTPAPVKKRLAHSRAAAKRKPKNELTAINPEPVEAARPSTPPPKPIRTVEPDAIQIGTAAAKVIELLGPPDLRAATTERGSLVQTYFYTRESGDDVALIHLRRGRVEP